MNIIDTQEKSGTQTQDIRIRHEAPEEKVFLGEEVGLLVHGCIAGVVAHEISKPKVTRVAEDGVEFVEIPGSMKGVIYGKGPVQRSHFEAFITLGGEEHCFIPHGRFEELSSGEAAAHEPATWKFTFEYTVKPCCCAGK